MRVLWVVGALIVGLLFGSLFMQAVRAAEAVPTPVMVEPTASDIASATQKSLEGTLGALIVNNTQCTQQNLAAAGVIADLRRQLAAAQAKSNEAPATGAPDGK